MHRSFYVPQAAQGPRPWRPVLSPHPARRAAARHLRRAGAWFAWAARQLAAPVARRPEPSPLPHVEYWAEAGAPEGALFIDGEYVGKLDVARL